MVIVNNNTLVHSFFGTVLRVLLALSLDIFRTSLPDGYYAQRTIIIINNIMCIIYYFFHFFFKKLHVDVKARNNVHIG